MSVAPERWPMGGAFSGRETDPKMRGLLLVRVKEMAVIAYFGTSFLYYIEGLPLGHIANLAFLFIFGALAVASRHPVVVFRAELVAVAALLLTFGFCVAGALVRTDAVFSDVATGLTWVLPIIFLIVLAQESDFRYGPVCAWVCVLNVATNLAVTATLAEFNPSLAKFELNVGPFDMSSNELSFHMVTFGLLFLMVAQYPRIRASGVLLALVSFLHLSKAHLAASVAGAVAAVARGRLTALIIAALVGMYLLRMAVESEGFQDLIIPDSVVAVFGRLRDMMLVAGQMLEGRDIAASALAEAIGGSRFLVYSAASEVVVMNPFGLAQSEVQRSLMGFDPHSNILYLAMREGVLVAAGYVVVCGLCIRAVRGVGKPSAFVFGLLAYVFIRSLLLTYDPVKILMVFMFVSRAVTLVDPPRASHLA